MIMRKLSVTAVLLLGACAHPGQAAETEGRGGAEARVPPPPRLTIVPSLLNRSTTLAQTVRQIESRRLLNTVEGRRFDELFGKATPTPAEAKELEALADTGIRRLTEYLGLIGKTTRTAAEAARIKELDALAATNETAVQKLRQGVGENGAAAAVGEIVAAPANPVMMQIYVTLVEQNKRLIEQNERIIALLTQMLAKPAAQ